MTKPNEQQPASVRDLTEMEYRVRKAELLGGGPAQAPKPAPSLADKPDSECIDVRRLPDAEYRRARSALTGRFVRSA